MATENVLNNRYRLVAQQGSGGMAVIYKAIDLSLGRTVAIKILRPSLMNDPTGAFITRFRNEARSIANLSHPNIVTVHDVGNDGPAHYIVMEFIEGQDLKKIIRTYGVLSVDRALNLAVQICAGIGFAHRAGLVHADVKPQNILVTSEDLVKVTDFGIAQALSDSQPGERQSVVWGSPHYFAPEQARGEKPTPASDVYAIGIVLFELLTGQLPYTGTNQQELALAHIRDRIPLATEINPNVPEALSRIVYKAMSKEPNARYNQAGQLEQILTAYRERGREHTLIQPSQPPVSGPPPTTPPQIQPTQPRQSAVPPSSHPGYTSPAPGYPQQGSSPVSPPANVPPVQGSPVQPPRPLQDSVRPVASAEPTQRYSVAPEAPQAPVYGNRPAVPAAQQSAYPQPVAPYQSVSSGTGPFQPNFPEDRRFIDGDEPQGLDLVTIVLAGLAFMAVACLIPLYIIVFQRLST